MHHTINLDNESETRLAVLVKARRLSPERLLQEIVDDQLLELAANREADDVYERYLAGNEETVSLEKLEK